ncbi:hypothetical protein ACVR1G_05310 [Streptococcus dentasini]
MSNMSFDELAEAYAGRMNAYSGADQQLSDIQMEARQTFEAHQDILLDAQKRLSEDKKVKSYIAELESNLNEFCQQLQLKGQELMEMRNGEERVFRQRAAFYNRDLW